MSDFTYESETKSTPLETFEWDNAWIEHTENGTAGRVLYIGDSISCGTRRVATNHTGLKILFDGFGTSKAVDNPYFKDSLSLFGKQLPGLDVVVFNNGLHGWHLEDDTAYKAHYEDMIRFLLKEFAGTPVAVVLTTYVDNLDRADRVIRRNEVATAIAEKYNLPIIDLYTVAKDSADLLSPDKVHFTQPGYEKLAAKMVERVVEIAPQLKYE